MASSSTNVTDFRRQISGKLSSDRMEYVFPTVTGKTRGGKNTYWVLIVQLLSDDEQVPIRNEYFDSDDMPDDIYAKIIVRSWQEGGEPKKLEPTIVTEGKNIGKSNQTNVFTQALRDAQGRYDKHVRKQSKHTIKKAPEVSIVAGKAVRYPPMAAKKYRDFTGEIDWNNCYIQRKLDGIRAVITLEFKAEYIERMTGSNESRIGTFEGVGESRSAMMNAALGSHTDACVGGMNTSTYTTIDLMKNATPDDVEMLIYSRGDKDYYNMDYLIPESMNILFPLFKKGTHAYLDGELYIYGKPLQELSGIVRRKLKPRNGEDEMVDFHIFDMFIPERIELPFSDRNKLLTELYNKFLVNRNINRYLHLVQTYKVTSERQAMEYFERFIEEGYEGAILKRDLPYEYSYSSYHSQAILKIKNEEEEEFEVAGYTQGSKGAKVGAIIFILKTKDGKEFKVNPAMTDKERKELFKKMSKVESNGKTFFQNHYLGKLMTITYESLSKEGIPLRAKTEGVIRDYE
jgi:hypothetical protein